MTEKLLVPDIGDFENVEVIELLVKEGQEIKKNDPVITIESDKSSVEIPSIFSGKIESIVVKIGDKVSKDDLILNISSVDQKLSTSQDVPKNTENLIQEAENSLKKTQEQKKPIEKIENKLFRNPSLYLGEGYMNKEIVIEEGTLDDFLKIITASYNDYMSNNFVFKMYESISTLFKAYIPY